MNEKFFKTITIISSFLVFLLLGIVLFQQRTISLIKKQVLPSIQPEEALEQQLGANAPSSKEQAGSEQDSLKGAVKNDFIENTKRLAGAVKQVSSQTLILEGEIYDLDKAEIAEAPGGGYMISDKTPKIKKEYTIKTTDKTSYKGGFNLSNLKSGNYLVITAEEPVYKSTSLTAVEITTPEPK